MSTFSNVCPSASCLSCLQATRDWNEIKPPARYKKLITRAGAVDSADAKDERRVCTAGCVNARAVQAPVRSIRVEIMELQPMLWLLVLILPFSIAFFEGTTCVQECTCRYECQFPDVPTPLSIMIAGAFCQKYNVTFMCLRSPKMYING